MRAVDKSILLQCIVFKPTHANHKPGAMKSVMNSSSFQASAASSPRLISVDDDKPEETIDKVLLKTISQVCEEGKIIGHSGRFLSEKKRTRHCLEH